jgi:hypothetical protein
MSLRAKSGTEVKTLRAMTSRSTLANQFFDLVEPGGIGRSVVEMDFGVSREELLCPLGLVGREVVGNEMNLLAARLIGDHFGEKGHELVCRESGIRRNYRAGDHPRLVRGQEQCDSCDIFRLAYRKRIAPKLPLDRLRLWRSRIRIVGVAEAFQHPVGLHQSRADRVGANSILRILPRQRPREPDDPALRGNVHMRGEAAQRRHRRHVHDCAAAALGQFRDPMTATMKGPLQSRAVSPS